VVNEESQLIRLEDMRSPAPLPKNLPVAAPAAKLAGGRDGNEVLTAEDFIGHDHGPSDRTGLMSLGAVNQVAMLSVPDAMLPYSRKAGPEAEMLIQRVHDAMINMCENLKDRFSLLDLPPTRDIEEIRKWRRRYDTSYAAVYYPWIGVSSNEARWFMPPSGHLAGIVARCDTNVGVHKAPANEVIEGSNGLSIDLSEEHLGILNGDGVNSLRSFPGRGVRVWGARTTSEDPDWRYVNVRRLFIMLRRSLEEGTQWAVYEPNEKVTWQRLQREIEEFLNSLLEQGYFAGGTPNEAFFVRCDESTVTREDQDAGRMIVQIGVAPAVPTEYIIFDLVQKIGEEASAAE
jgi:phage tail sheath protein FI